MIIISHYLIWASRAFSISCCQSCFSSCSLALQSFCCPNTSWWCCARLELNFSSAATFCIWASCRFAYTPSTLGFCILAIRYSNLVGNPSVIFQAHGTTSTDDFCQNFEMAQTLSAKVSHTSYRLRTCLYNFSSAVDRRILLLRL